MKCPKCGYNSFDHLENCKKCGKDLTEFKQRYGIKSVLFPGQMSPSVVAEEQKAEEGVDVAAAAAAAAAAATAVAADEPVETSAPPSVAEEVTKPSSEADDFGFDFMGDSEEEEDLSFDELFEEAPADEDVEETLPAPEEEKEATDDLAAFGEFSFDDDESSEESMEQTLPEESELEEDFGFDLDQETAEKTPSVSDDADENLDEADFQLPPADEDDEFSFASDEIDFTDSEDETGDEGDPKDPFDLPELSPGEGVPAAEQSEITLQRHANDADQAHSAPEGNAPDVDRRPAEATLVEEESAPAEDLLPPEPPSAREESDSEAIPAEEASSVESSQLDVSRDERFEEPVGGVARSVGPPTADPFAEDDNLLLAPSSPEVASADFVPSQKTETEQVDFVIPDDPFAEDHDLLAEAGPLLDAPAMTDAGLSSSPSLAPFPPLTSRIVAFLCDILLLALIAVSFIVAAEAAMSSVEGRLFPSFATLLDLSIPYFLVLFSLAFSYFTLFHFLAGQTPGKMLTGLRVETLEGEPILLSQAFLRSVGGLLQLLPVGLGYLLILFSPDRRGWNDRLAGTRLVDLKGMVEEG